MRWRGHGKAPIGRIWIPDPRIASGCRFGHRTWNSGGRIRPPGRWHPHRHQRRQRFGFVAFRSCPHRPCRSVLNGNPGTRCILRGSTGARVAAQSLKLQRRVQKLKRANVSVLAKETNRNVVARVAAEIQHWCASAEWTTLHGSAFSDGSSGSKPKV